MQPNVMLALGLGLVLLLTLLRVFGRPFQWLMRQLGNSAIAVVGIFLWNHWAQGYGLSVGLNPVTAIVSGILGVPGFLLVLAVKVFGV